MEKFFLGMTGGWDRAIKTPFSGFVWVIVSKKSSGSYEWLGENLFSTVGEGECFFKDKPILGLLRTVLILQRC